MPRGRPKGSTKEGARREHLSLRLTKEEKKQVREAQEKTGLSVADLLMRGIK